MFFRHETPMKRLFRAFRGPFIGAHGTRFPKKPREESPTSHARSRKCSSVSQPSSHRTPALTVLEDTLQATGAAMRNGDTLPANVSPALVEYVQKILDISRELTVLRRRFRVADTKDLDNEGRVLGFYRLLREKDVELEDDSKLGRQLEQLEEAYLYSDKVKKRLMSHIKCEEENLQFARESLEQELKNLLAPLNLLEVPDCASRISEHDFAEDEDKEQTDHTEGQSAQMLEVEEDPEVQGREDAAASWRQAKSHLHTMRLKFDRHEDFYDHDLDDYLKAVAEGCCDASRTVFDLMHVTELQELTQELIEAERQYDEVAFQAMQLGVIELTPSQSSWFVDQEGDDQEQAEEAAMSIARTNMSRIEKWKEGLVAGISSDAVEQGGLGDPSEWGVRSIVFGDGISAYADGRERGKIDKWDELRMEDWKITQEQDFLKPEAATGVIMPKRQKVSMRSRARSCAW